MEGRRGGMARIVRARATLRLPPFVPSAMPRHAPLLLTGFEAFDGRALNASWEAVRALEGERIGAHVLRVARLPCRFGSAIEQLQQALDRHRPALVLCVGEALNRQAFSLERVAINWIDARIPDNDGCQPIDQAVRDGAPAAYFSRLPIKAMAQALRAAGLPAEISYSAGSYVCNQVFFGLMHALRRRRAPAGFLHVPGLETVDADTQSRALRIALQAALDAPPDLQGVSAGQES